MPVKMKVKPCTHGFFADNHLLDLHDLCYVISRWFERCSTCPVIDANENVSTNVLTAINAYQPTTLGRLTSNNKNVKIQTRSLNLLYYSKTRMRW